MCYMTQTLSNINRQLTALPEHPSLNKTKNILSDITEKYGNPNQQAMCIW